MSDATLRRGCVVVRGRRYGVVWAVAGGQIDVIPILDPHHAWANDVELAPEERLVAGVPIANAVIRASTRMRVPRAEQQRVGALSPALLQQLHRAVDRAGWDAVVRQRWACDRDHRERAHVPGAVGSRNADRLRRAA